jgi:hypothetical protein
LIFALEIPAQLPDVSTILAVIGAATGVVSLLAIVYTLGYKFGAIESTLRHLSPKEFGEIKAKVDMLSSLYLSDRQQAISKDLSHEIAGASKKPNPGSQLSELLKLAFEKLGLRVEDSSLYVLSTNENELKEVESVSQLRELSSRTLQLKAKIWTAEEENAIFEARFRIMPDKTVEILGTDVDEVTFTRKSLDNQSMRVLVPKAEAYVDTIARIILPLIIQTLFRT